MSLHPLEDEHLKTLRQILRLDDLEIFIGHATPNQRSELRQQVINTLKDKGIAIDQEEMLNLEHLPRLNKGDLSLSHSQKHQGFLFSQKCSFAGFDIEDPGRVSDPIIKRVSKEKEVQSAPDPSLLWVAKEAAFKMFSKTMGAKLLSEVSIDHWMPITDGVFAVRATFGKHSQDGFACALSDCFYSGFKS